MSITFDYNHTTTLSDCDSRMTNPDQGGLIPEIKGNLSDVFRDADTIQINIGGTWKEVIGVQINIGGVWKTVF